MKLKAIKTINPLIILILLLLQPLQLHANSQASSNAYEALEKILNQPDPEIDLLSTLLTIEKIVDPTVNTSATKAEIDRLVENIASQLQGNESPINIVSLISEPLYEYGPENNSKPYQYDFDDPLGTKISNKLVSNYIRTHKGNCVSMPMLYFMVADKLGIDCTLSTAPLHLFVMVKEPVSNKYFNVEATHKGQIATEQFYIEKLRIKPAALQNGIYLQPLSKKEIISVMAITLSEHYAEQQQWEKSIAIAKLAVKYYPNYAYAMVKIANGYYKLLANAVAKAEKGYTTEEKQHMDYLYKNNLAYLEKAESLGWEQPSSQQNLEYFESIKKHSASN